MTVRSRHLVLFSVVALIALPAAARAETVTIQADPGGRVTSQPAGINCPGACVATFPGAATLTARPAQGYAFGAPNDNGAPGNQDGWLNFGGDTCTHPSGQPEICSVPGDEPTFLTAHFRPAAQLDVVPSGRGSVTATIPNPGAGEQASQTCFGDAQGGVSCEYTYLPGREVTLVASPDTTEGPSSFVRWSDERCPAGPVCTLTMDAARQSIVALFTPQRVSVKVSGAGHLTSTPAGLDCQGNSDPSVDVPCSHDFPIGTDVTIAASPLSAQAPAWFLPCDFGGGSACGITGDRARWAAVGFDGQVPDIAQVPPTITVRFHILKAGSGSGRVQGGSIDCGGSCSVLRDFGARQTLTAIPDAGSRFAGWRSACSSAATCTLAVGPVTAVTAAFDASGSSSSSSSGRPSSSPGQGPSTAFKASLARSAVKGHGRKRVVVFNVRVSTLATVRARLTRKQRMVASRSWRVGAGVHQLRLRLPRKAKAGAYRLR